MSLGKIAEFDVNSGNWSSFVDRLDMYFVVNKVAEAMKLPSLIATMGDEAYELLVNLAIPEKPSNLKYQRAVELLRNHLQPTPSALAERYRFRQRRQNISEDIATYVSELKRLSRHCQFGETLNDNLRDQFICGLRIDTYRQRLFAESDSLSFTGAVKLATCLEAAERDAALVERSATSAAGAESSMVHALAPTAEHSGRERARTPARGSSRPRIAERRDSQRRGRAKSAHCAACGARNHEYGSCRYREFVCSKCQRTGHLRRVCPEHGETSRAASYRGGPEQKRVNFGDAEELGEKSTSEEDNGEEDFNLLCLKNYKSVSVPVAIEGRVIKMEIDTGTAISCVSKSTYDAEFPHLPIEEDNTILKFYDGSKIKPIGLVKPVVRYLGREMELELFVIDRGTTSLLGRQWLAELGIDIPRFCRTENVFNCKTKMNSEISDLIDRYKELFSGGLGRYLGGKATLRVRDGAVPVFHRARPLPYALRERVDAELDAMLRDGVIEPVDCSDWASPLVPVHKPDGTLRICADYKATLNPALLVDRFPLPRIEDVLVGLNGAQYFSKIDLSQAYNQVELDDTKFYTVVNTHRGLFRYNRLVFGLSSSVGIFQRIMTNLFRDIPNVQVFLDDVIVGGRNKAEHISALNAVFQRLLENGLKLKKSKCVFLAEEVSYLGYIVSRDGIKADRTKIEAIQKISKPSNVSELRSFLGMVNFFGKFIRNFSSLLVPFNNLLRKGVEWRWSIECERSFCEVKRALTGVEVLAHYDPTKPLVVTCDASGRGIGAVLAQRGASGERPVAYASRSLSSAEKNYSQIHREALAIIFALKKFHQYLYGRKFVLRTDHKPLVSIFGANSGIPAMTASRMQRWAIILSAYDYEIEYIKTDANCADGLSRLPVEVEEKIGSEQVIPEQTYLHFAQDALLLDHNELKRQTGRDPILGRVISFLRDGWPEKCEIVGLQPYFNRKAELYEELGCVMWGHRVVIPELCQKRVLSLIHEPHMGVVKSKALARSYVWWAGIDEAVERECRACNVCAAHADAPPRSAPTPWPWPARPWSRLHLDFMGPTAGKLYLVIVDAMSKWLEIFAVPSTAARFTISKLSELWSRWGIPRQIVTDNGPPFTSSEFGMFLKQDGIEHIFSAPYHPASNGAAENAVRTLKRVIKKALFIKTDVEKSLHTFLLHYRNTEHSSTGQSPSILLLGRRLRTRLDVLKPDREAKVSCAQQRQVSDAGGANRTFLEGEEVWYRQYLKGDKWLPGRVARAGLKDYTVVDSEGRNIHRHVDQLRRRSKSTLAYPLVSGLSVSSPLASHTGTSAEPTEPAIQSEHPAPSSAVAARPANPPAELPEQLATPQSPSTPASPRHRPIRTCTIVNKPNYRE